MDADLDDVMLNEAIWLSIQVSTVPSLFHILSRTSPIFPSFEVGSSEPIFLKALRVGNILRFLWLS